MTGEPQGSERHARRLDLNYDKYRRWSSNQRGAYETQKRNYPTRAQSTSQTMDAAEHAGSHSCHQKSSGNAQAKHTGANPPGDLI